MIIHGCDQDTLFPLLCSVAIFETRRELIYKHMCLKRSRGDKIQDKCYREFNSILCLSQQLQEIFFFISACKNSITTILVWGSSLVMIFWKRAVLIFWLLFWKILLDNRYERPRLKSVDTVHYENPHTLTLPRENSLQYQQNVWNLRCFI